MTMKLNARGFTLVEMLVVIALVGLVVTLVGNFNLLNQHETQQNQLLNQQQDVMRRFVDTIVPIIRAGSWIVDASGTPIAGSGVLTLNPANIGVQLPSGAAYRIGLNGDVLWVSATPTAADTAAHQSVCPNVGSLSATYDTSLGLLHITIESLAEIPGINTGLPIKMETSVLLRNAGG